VARGDSQQVLSIEEPVQAIVSERNIRLAWRDLAAAGGRWSLIAYLAWHDIRARYRRSVLGPSWLTISVAVQIGALGLVYGSLFHMDVAKYLPHLAASMTVWALIASMINEGCTSFIASESYLKQGALPKAMFPARVVLRSLFNFGHDLIIVVIVLAIWPPALGWPTLLVFPGLALVAANGLWIGLLVGMLCARFRDLPPIVASIMQVAFFVTPVIWIPNALSGHAATLLALNPFAVFLSLVRDPLLGEVVPVSRWAIALAITLFGWVLAFAVFARFRARITYWL
jgi:ABC-type polysaccharide/polyol phosphate export permease